MAQCGKASRCSMAVPGFRFASSGLQEEDLMDLRGNWNYPTSVRFGAGRVRELGEAVKAAGMRNPLFVTDPVVAKMPMTAAAMQVLADAGAPATLFSDVQPNPVEANLAAGIAAFKAGGHD